METKREALLAEELGNLYSNSNIFVFLREQGARTNTIFVKPRIFIENPNPCTFTVVPGSVAIAYRTSHR
jgi:hypothetical protein